VLLRKKCKESYRNFIPDSEIKTTFYKSVKIYLDQPIHEAAQWERDTMLRLQTSA